jgi:hypothetical protein
LACPRFFHVEKAPHNLQRELSDLQNDGRLRNVPIFSLLCNSKLKNLKYFGKKMSILRPHVTVKYRTDLRVQMTDERLAAVLRIVMSTFTTHIGQVSKREQHCVLH